MERGRSQEGDHVIHFPPIASGAIAVVGLTHFTFSTQAILILFSFVLNTVDRYQ